MEGSGRSYQCTWCVVVVGSGDRLTSPGNEQLAARGVHVSGYSPVGGGSRAV